MLRGQSYRHSDELFESALDKIRVGRPDAETFRILAQCCRPPEHNTSIKPTKIYPYRALVNEENSREFQKLDTEIYEYTSIDTQYYNDENGLPNLKTVFKDLPAARTLKLRVGMQVMLLANLNVTEGLVNGSRGIVVSFVSMQQAISHLRERASLRGGTPDDDIQELRNFSRGKEMKFPKVLFESENSAKTVIILNMF
jgi:ATP-dependent DNA helicase PIF1